MVAEYPILRALIRKLQLSCCGFCGREIALSDEIDVVAIGLIRGLQTHLNSLGTARRGERAAREGVGCGVAMALGKASNGQMQAIVAVAA